MKPHFTLKMAGTIDVVAAFEPGWVNLGKVARGTSKSQVIAMTGRDVANVKLSAITANDPTRILAEAVTQDGKPALKVTVLPSDKDGVVAGTVTVSTGLQKPPTLSVTVRAEIGPDVQVEPPRMALTKSPTDPVSTGRVVVKTLSGKPFAIKRLEDPEKSITGAFKKLDDGSWAVTVTLLKPDKATGKFRLETDRKDQPTVEVEWFVTSGPPPQLDGAAMKGRPAPIRAGGIQRLQPGVVPGH